MKILLLLLAAASFSACQTTQPDDPSSLTFEIPKGTVLTLNKELEIPPNKTHATLQFGTVTTDRERDDYRLNCRFDVKQFGPRTIQPEAFKVRRTEDGQEWISQAAGIIRFYSDIFLDSDKGTDVVKLTCQEQGSKLDRNFTVTEMESALGDYFRFTSPQRKSTKPPGY